MKIRLLVLIIVICLLSGCKTFEKEGAGASGISYPLNGTPLSTDQVLGIDDPAGTWAINRFALSAFPISTAMQTALDLKANQVDLDTTNAAVALNTAKVTEQDTGTNTGDQVGDGVTITGVGTAGDPFVAVGGSGAVDSVNGLTGVVVLDKTDIGLGNVDNTADVNKPVSTPQQTAFDDKADKTNVLELDNTTPFTPDADNEPATKKYVDDKNAPAVIGTTTTGASTVLNLTSAAQVVTFTQASDVTATGCPATGFLCKVYLRVVNAGAYPTSTIFGRVVGSGDLNLTAAGTDILVCISEDGGATYSVTVSALNASIQ